jgi:hypothetical protein
MLLARLVQQVGRLSFAVSGFTGIEKSHEQQAKIARLYFILTRERNL